MRGQSSPPPLSSAAAAMSTLAVGRADRRDSTSLAAATAAEEEEEQQQLQRQGGSTGSPSSFPVRDAGAARRLRPDASSSPPPPLLHHHNHHHDNHPPQPSRQPAGAVDRRQHHHLDARTPARLRAPYHLPPLLNESAPHRLLSLDESAPRGPGAPPPPPSTSSSSSSPSPPPRPSSPVPSAASTGSSEIEAFSFAATPPLPPPLPPKDAAKPAAAADDALGLAPPGAVSRQRSRSLSQALRRPRATDLLAGIRKRSNSRAPLTSSASQDSPATASSTGTRSKPPSLSTTAVSTSQLLTPTQLSSPLRHQRNAGRPRAVTNPNAEPPGPASGRSWHHSDWPSTPNTPSDHAHGATTAPLASGAAGPRSRSSGAGSLGKNSAGGAHKPRESLLLLSNSPRSSLGWGSVQAAGIGYSPTSLDNSFARPPHSVEERDGSLGRRFGKKSRLSSSETYRDSAEQQKRTSRDGQPQPQSATRGPRSLAGLGLFAPEEEGHVVWQGNSAAASAVPSSHRPFDPSAADPASPMQALSGRPSSSHERSWGRTEAKAAAASSNVRSPPARASEDVIYPDDVYRSASRASYLPMSDALDARRAVSPTFIEGPASSLRPPESAWRSGGQDGFWQRPHIGVGLPTAYHHERPAPRFVEQATAPVLPRSMMTEMRALDDTPVPAPQISPPAARASRLFDPSSAPRAASPRHLATGLPLPSAGSRPSRSHTVSSQGSSSPRQHGPRPLAPTPSRQHAAMASQHRRDHPRRPSNSSFATAGSTDGRATPSSSQMLTDNTSVTSLLQPRPGHDTPFDADFGFKRDYRTVAQHGQYTPFTEPSVVDRRPRSSATSSQPQAHAGPSRAPVLSPIASSLLGDRSSYSRSTPNLAQPQPAAECDTRALERLRAEERRAHSVSRSGYLEPMNGCEAVFLPRPRLRSQSSDDLGREYRSAGGVARWRQRQHQPATEGRAEMTAHRSDHDDAANGTDGSRYGRATPLSLRRWQDTDVQGQTPRPGDMPHVPERDSSTRTDHARANSSYGLSGGYASDSEVGGRAFFHHRMPPPPPAATPAAARTIQDGRRSRNAVSPTPSLVRGRTSCGWARGASVLPGGDDDDDDTEEELDSEDDPPDIGTVLRQGRALDAERAEWRRQHQRSLSIGSLSESIFARRPTTPDSRDVGVNRGGILRHRSRAPSVGGGLGPSSASAGDMPGTGATPGRDADAGTQRATDESRHVVWTDRRTGRSFLIMDDAEAPERTARSLASRSTPNLHASARSKRWSVEPAGSSRSFCKPIVKCVAPSPPPPQPPPPPTQAAKERTNTTLNAPPGSDATASQQPPTAAAPRLTFGQRLRAKSFSFLSSRAPAQQRPAKPVPVQEQNGAHGGTQLRTTPPTTTPMRPAPATISGRYGRSLVSDEPVVIGNFAFPAPPNREEGAGQQSAAPRRPAEGEGRVPPPPVRPRPSRYLELSHLVADGDEQLADDAGGETSGNESSQMGVAFSSRSETTSPWASQSDIEALASSLWTEAEQVPRTLPQGRYPTKGYHRPTNSGEIRAQLSHSRSSSLSQPAPVALRADARPTPPAASLPRTRADSRADPRAGKQRVDSAAFSKDLPPPPPPSFPVSSVPVPVPPPRIEANDDRLALPPQGSFEFDRRVHLRTGSGDTAGYGRSSLPVPPRKPRAAAVQGAEASNSNPLRGAGGGGGSGSGGPFRTPKLDASSPGGGTAAFRFHADEPQQTTPRAVARGPFDWSLDLSRSRSRDEEEYGYDEEEYDDDDDGEYDEDEEFPRLRGASGRSGRSGDPPTGETEGARRSGSGSTGDDGATARTSTSSVEGREVWDANEASIENLFFRPPPPLSLALPPPPSAQVGRTPGFSIADEVAARSPDPRLAPPPPPPPTSSQR